MAPAWDTRTGRSRQALRHAALERRMPMKMEIAAPVAAFRSFFWRYVEATA
jgi:hypothetical protein